MMSPSLDDTDITDTDDLIEDLIQQGNDFFRPNQLMVKYPAISEN